MKRSVMLPASAIVALVASLVMGAEAVPKAFRDYETAVVCCVRKHRAEAVAPDCPWFELEVAVMVEMADRRRPGAVGALGVLSDPYKSMTERQLGVLDETLAKVKAVLVPPVRLGEPRPPGRTLIDVLIIEDDGSRSKHRKAPELFVSMDDTSAHYYLSTEPSELFELEPRLYRAFLQNKLGAQRPVVTGDLPPEMVRDDLEEVLDKLRGADASVLMQFARLFPIQDGASFGSYLEQTAEVNEATPPAKFMAMRNEVQKQARIRSVQRDALAVLGDFDAYDRSTTKTAWLGYDNALDPWAMRDLLEDSTVNLLVRQPSGTELLVPVRPDKAVGVSDGTHIQVDGFRFRPDQMKGFEIPERSAVADK